MKHVANYLEFLYEGKKQYAYTLKVKPTFNIFSLLQDLRPLGAEVLDNKSTGKSKDEIIVTIALDDSKKDAVEKVIANNAEILNAK
jgi:hypothetical protein